MSRTSAGFLLNNGRHFPINSHGGGERPFQDIDRRGEPSPLLLTLDSAQYEVGTAHFVDVAATESVRRLVANAQQLVWDISALPSWQRGVARETIRALGDLRGLRSTSFICGTINTPSLFEASLGLIVNGSNPTNITSSIELAIEAAIADCPDDIDAAIGQIHSRITAVRIRGFGVRALRRLVQDRTAALRQPATPSVPTSIAGLLPGIEGVENLICPAGWEVGDYGIRRQGGDVVNSTPVIIGRVLVEAESERESVELIWLSDGLHRRRIVERTIIAVSRLIVDLAGFGIGITSNTAADLVQYLSDFEAANRAVLPRTQMTKHIGWQGQDCSAFLWGNEEIRAAGNDPRDDDNRQLVFVGDGEGDEQLVDGFQATGTLEGWLNAMQPLQAYPRVLLALYASLAAVLLPLLNAANFVISFAGVTSAGKTTALRISASIWGNPDEQQPNTVVGVWDATRVWIERTLATLYSLPLIIDDTKRARSAKDIAQTVYDVCGGRGRGRGDLRGTLRSLTWRTIMLTTGEAPLASFSQDGGTRARIMEMWGSPFVSTTEETANVVNSANRNVKQHYGHAGPMFVRFMQASQERWPRWQQHFTELRDQFQQLAGTNTVAGRMAEHFAVLRLAELLAHEALPLPWPCGNVIEALWPELTSETTEADRAGAALDFVSQWAEAHKGEFAGGPTGRPSDHLPFGGWVGRWRIAARNGDGEALGFYPFRLDQLLREQGFEPEAVRRTWRDRGWLRHSEGKTTLKARVEREGTVEVVAIRVAVMQERLECGAEPRPVPEPRGQLR